MLNGKLSHKKNITTVATGRHNYILVKATLEFLISLKLLFSLDAPNSITLFFESSFVARHLFWGKRIVQYILYPEKR